MIVLRTPKGWTCPKTVDGLKTEGFWRSHQVPFTLEKPEHFGLLEHWMKSYRPEELFDTKGALKPEIAALAPKGTRRMSANPHGNGGALRRPLHLPDFTRYAVKVGKHGAFFAESTKVLGTYLRDVIEKNEAEKNFRLLGPDETDSNRL